MAEQAAWLANAETTKAWAWRAADLGPESSWRCSLRTCTARAVLDLARTLAGGPVPIVETRLGDSNRLAWSGDLAPAADALENGRGFAIVDGPAEQSLSLETQLATYWLIGQIFGEPVTQNVEGVRLYDVRDTGQSLSQGARFSVTNYESTFHTDASFEDGVVDYVGLLCVQTAKSGGLSQLVSGISAAAELAQADPAALEVLARPFHVDRRGGVRPGEPPTTQRPVLERRGDEILYRYLRTWIEAGHQKASVPLTSEQVRASMPSTARSGVGTCARSSCFAPEICCSSTTAGSCTTGPGSKTTPCPSGGGITSGSGCAGGRNASPSPCKDGSTSFDRSVRA